MGHWDKIKDNIVEHFYKGFVDGIFTYILQLILFTVVFYMMFKVLKNNKVNKFMLFIILIVVLSGLAFVFSDTISSAWLVFVIALCAILVFVMFETDIKRGFLDSGSKKSKKAESFTVTGVELIIEEIVRAVQNMSKADVGALIVLSDDNLPEGIIESGTVINAQITSQMIEAVFYPKAPLHDGALVIEGNKLFAAGCFLPLIQDETLPKEMGSRHRAALGVTMVASVTAIVVSEETGIISIVKNGAIKKKYADAADIKSALSDYYWSDLTAEDKI